MKKETRLRGRPKAFLPKKDQTRIQSLDRAVDVMECVASGGGITLSEIASELDQSPATVYRILSTFSTRDVLSMDAASQEWFVGPASFRIGSAFLRRSNVVERARPVMRRLMVKSGETANLGVENGRQVLFLSQVETQQNIRAFFPPGAQSPMHASGIGKALLAFTDASQIDSYIENTKLEAFTANTIATEEALRAELKLIKSTGFAFDNEEKNTGMRCVAAPIFNAFGEVVAGISISGPSERLSLERIGAVGALVLEQANLLSAGSGYDPEEQRDQT